MQMEGVLSRRSLYGFEFREVDGRRSEDRNTHDIKALWQRSHEIVNLASTGMKQTEIAKILNISAQTVSNTLNSDLGMQKLSDVREEKDDKAKELHGRIAELTEKALDVYEEIFRNPVGEADLKMRKDTADTVALDLGGLRAPTKIHSSTLTATATLEEIEDFKRRGVKAARASGMIVDVELEADVNEASKDSPS